MDQAQATQPAEQTERRRRIDNPAGSSSGPREDVLKCWG